MTLNEFQKMVAESFPLQMPDKSRLFEGVRIESGHERLQILQTIAWPNLTVEIIGEILNEFFQLSSVWQKYFLPAAITLTSNATLDLNEFGEIEDGNQEALCEFVFYYWVSIGFLQNAEFQAKENIFSGLTTPQIMCVAHWINAVDFEALARVGQVPSNFNHSKEGLAQFIKMMNDLKLTD